MIWLLAFIGLFLVALFVADKLLAAPKYEADQSDHYDGKKFVNPNAVGNHSYWDVLKWWFSGNDKGDWEKLEIDQVQQFAPATNDSKPQNGQITFVNHMTFLLQIDGLNILTDPIWSDRASPYQWIGPKRMRPPGIDFDALPPIDLVLISHNHYDHLDIRTVKQLDQQYRPEFIVPLGVEKFLHNHGINNTKQMDWWDQCKSTNNVDLTAVPARHFSGRGLFDRNQTLWCGYVLHSSLGNIYFAGDTGYGDFFNTINKQFGAMHTSLLPIGAYKPRWFMKAIHMSPEEAVRAHLQLQSRQSIATHFGTFPMADDGMQEAKADLQSAREKYGITNRDFIIPQEGEPESLQETRTTKKTGIA
jgi:L-ascorbate metabolism protein UlaG (beta-lactamase superfamily)